MKMPGYQCVSSGNERQDKSKKCKVHVRGCTNYRIPKIQDLSVYK